MSSISLQPTRGMRDFYPEDFAKREALFNAWKDVANTFGFSLYDAPVVENLDLLKRKGGEEIVDQIYEFTDKSGRSLALRAEMTPSLVRMAAAIVKTVPLPLKWSAIPQCFRYERMSVGRRREHYQWNLDIIGDYSINAESELIAAGITLLKKLGFTSQELGVKVGSRQVIIELLECKGISQDEAAHVYTIIDKRGKITDEEIADLLKDNGFDEQKTASIFEILAISSLDQAKSMLGNTQGIQELEGLFDLLGSYGLSDWLEFDISIVRGLAYYTGIVFEGFDRGRQFRALFGGGRYNNLFKQLTDIDLPAVGMGMGDVGIEVVIEHFGKEYPGLNKPTHFAFFTNETMSKQAISKVTSLRNDGQAIFLHPEPIKMKRGLAHADYLKADKCLIFDEHEAVSNQYLVKNLTTGEQELVEY